MRIFLHELKKIFTWRMILLLLFVNTILFFLLIEFHITYFPNGRPALDLYNVGVEMVEKYGVDMKEEEFQDFIKTYELKVKEADEFLQSRKEFVDANLDSYEKFRHYEYDDDVTDKLVRKVMFDERVDLFWELQARETLIEYYEWKEVGLENLKNDAKGAQKERLEELIEKGQYQVYTDVVILNFNDFIFNVVITIMISVVIVISPIFIKDRSRQLLDLQYTMKKGRNLYKTKALAGFISTFIVITVLLIVYFSLYSLNNTSMFFDIPIHMFVWDLYWYDLTFFQYIVLTVLAIYVLGFVFALLSMCFSNIMPNYITLIGIQVPFVVAMIAYGVDYLVTSIISLSLPKWAVPISYILLIVCSVLFIVYLWRREKRRDILI